MSGAVPREPEVLVVRRAAEDDPAIVRAAELLRRGRLVAFPTETVYGLGARVGDDKAVRSIYGAKGRPAGVPLIVHVGSYDEATTFMAGAPAHAAELAKAFWPGPLTMVCDRGLRVSDAVAAGGATVGVRMPDHPVALALIEALGEAIAAPSANMHNRLPPVRAEQVVAGLGGRIHAVLDGGRCPGGLESTVVDMRAVPVAVLRRGAVNATRLGLEVTEPGSVRSMELCGDWLSVGPAESFARWEKREDGPVGRVAIGASGGESKRVQRLPPDLNGYAAQMYDALHAMWSAGCRRVWLDAPSAEPEWGPVWDRLARLSASLAPPD